MEPTALTRPVPANRPDQDVRGHVQAAVVGREREVDLLLAAVTRGRDVVLEGPPGTSKTTLLRAITEAWGIPLIMVEGNAELTPARLLGYHDPARVLSEGYTAETFVPGPLVEAMLSGGFLYIEEFNRAPEDTLNTLLTAIADREMVVPRHGRVVARGSFRIVASMNPYDNVGTTRLSMSIRDRFCRLAITYQDADAEQEIVARRAGVDRRGPAAREIGDAVALTRATREHPDIRQGSSVRGAIDLYTLADELTSIRGTDRYPETVLDALLLALSGRILIDDTAVRSPEAVLREIWEQHFSRPPGAPEAPG
jgi:MoxR-like ATPase